MQRKPSVRQEGLFFRSGSSGQWHDYFDEDDRAYYLELARGMTCVRTHDGDGDRPDRAEGALHLGRLDGQGGALRCLFDMGNEIGNWGYRPILVLSKQVRLVPDARERTAAHLWPSLPRPKRGRSIRELRPRPGETVAQRARLARIIRRERVVTSCT